VAISDLGSALTSLGSIAALLAPTLAAVGITAGPLLAIIAALAVAFVGIKHILKAAHEASPEGRLEAA
jgi:hypothetical protein